MSLQQVALLCVCVCVCVCVLRVGQFGAGLGESVCNSWLCDVCVCVWCLCVLCVGQFRAVLRECMFNRWFVVCVCVCAACGTV